jgi:hypothetical protein
MASGLIVINEPASFFSGNAWKGMGRFTLSDAMADGCETLGLCLYRVASARMNGRAGGGPGVGSQMTGAKTSGIKTLNLVKGSEQFCFRYEVGQESQVLQSLIDMVNRRDMAFDWFDAAVLSHQLGQHLAKELKGYMPKKAA